MYITINYLNKHKDHIFVFGDNTIHKGLGGGAKLRFLPNTYGFITKKYPNFRDESFYKPEEYKKIYKEEIEKLKNFIINSPNLTFLISKLGFGLANKYKIFENIIEPNIKNDLNYSNVKFLW